MVRPLKIVTFKGLIPLLTQKPYAVFVFFLNRFPQLLDLYPFGKVRFLKVAC